MDITTLKNKIESSTISNELKREVLDMIDGEGVYSDELVQKIQKVLDSAAENLIEQATNLQIQDAVDEFNEETDKLEKEVDEFNQEIGKKINEIELVSVKGDLGINQ